MKIKVEFIGAINTGPYKKEQEFEVKEKTSIKSFLESLHFDPGHLNFIQVVKNGTRCAHTDTIKKGDKLELMLMVGGG